MTRLLAKLAAEPPFRLLAREVLRRRRCDLRTRMRWDVSDRPWFLLGLGTAALKAQAHGISAITAVEFGVASGQGLVALEQEAQAIERETGVTIRVAGFDRGRGLPDFCGDYRDHPDYWQPGDFSMDVPALTKRLRRAELVIGDIRDTAERLVTLTTEAPLGFVSVDVDLWSSSKDVLRAVTSPRVRRLLQTPVYFDDIMPVIAHSGAGELLAIAESNAETRTRVVIEPWRGVRWRRPFRDADYLDKMFILHDLQAISAVALRRETRQLALGA